MTTADHVQSSDTAASLVDALLVYAEPLAANAHAVVIGDAESSIADRLLDLGARSVYVFDPDPARAANAARTAQRGVTVRALVDELDVRDGAFDLAVVPDPAELNDPRGSIVRLRRAVAASGAVVAMGRAKLDEDAASEIPHTRTMPFGGELGPAALEYSELYDMFATQFDEVTLAGVVAFRGVVFAELGSEDEESPAVSVDTRLAPSEGAPSVFVVVAAQHDARSSRPNLDPYAIVQVPGRDEEAPPQQRDARVIEATFAALQLKADLLAAQLEEARDRVALAEVQTGEIVARLDRAGTERDSALTRAMELEAVLAASQQTMATLERRLLIAEQGILERDDRIAVLSAEIDSKNSRETMPLPIPVDAVIVADLVARAERAEAALALAAAEITLRRAEEEKTVHFNAETGQLRNRAEKAEAALAVIMAELNARQEADATVHMNAPDVGALRERAERAESALATHIAELSVIAEAHEKEAETYEQYIRDRARVIAGLEKEVIRREQLVKELVLALEEARESNGATAHVFEAAPMSNPLPPRVDPAATEEIGKLRKKLDELSAEVARREGELIARAWRITELENAQAAAAAAAAAAAPGSQKPAEEEKQSVRRGPAAAAVETRTEMGTSDEISAALTQALNELDALRQALAQEHAARLAAESGEELAHARSELARQATLLEQMRGRIEML